MLYGILLDGRTLGASDADIPCSPHIAAFHASRVLGPLFSSSRKLPVYHARENLLYLLDALD